MMSLLCAAVLSAALGGPPAETRVVTIQSARKCAALGEAEPGKSMNTAWVVTLRRER